MNANKALWEKGDFTRIAATHARERRGARRRRSASPRACEVLDLGCGDGTTALPAARARRRRARRRHRQQPRRGRQRARRRAAGLTQPAASRRATPPTSTSSPTISFDLVVSIFGAMFAPRPFDVAKEMVRVTRPGGRIVMGNWIPGDPTLVAQILKISSAYSPPPPEGFVSPMTWGVEDNVIERFAARRRAPRRDLASRATPTRSSYPAPPAEFLDRVPDLLRADDERVRGGRSRTAAPPSCRRELEALFNEQNTSGERRIDVDPGDVPAGHRQRSDRQTASGTRMRARCRLRLVRIGTAPSSGRSFSADRPPEAIVRRVAVDVDSRSASPVQSV